MRSVLDGDAILFVGAGISFLSRQQDGERIPNTDTLVDLLLEQPLGTGSKHALDRVAGSVVREKGAEYVSDLLKKNFLVSSIDPKLETLYSVAWKRIYTTNYDNAAETARAGKFPISSVTIDEPKANASTGSIIHLNGYIKRINAANLDKDFLLTDASYAASRLISTGWLSFFERDLKTSRAIIFVGYSLYDLEIDQALLAAEGISQRTFFFIAPDADKIEISTLERYGTVVPGGIEALTKKLEDVKADYKPPTFVQGFTALREISPPKEFNTASNSAEKISAQLVFGRLPEREILAREFAFDKQSYLVLRKQDLAARTAIRNGTWRDILFVGEIASGKSASTLTLSLDLLDQGYKIFLANQGTTLVADLHRLSKLPDKVAVIFDGYSPFRKEIAEYAERRPANHRIILTERSAVHAFIGNFVERTPHLGPVREIALDRIDDTDVPAFESLVNFGGFWGERAGASPATRQKLISNELDGSLYRLLMEIIESKKVQSLLSELLKPLSFEPKISKAFCSILIVNALGGSFSIGEWQYLFDRQLIRRMLNNYSEQVQHFLLSDANYVYIRNGLLSTHILRTFVNDELVRECLVDLYENAEHRAREGVEWNALWIALTKFSSIEPMFSGATKTQNVFSYYDQIRIFGETRNNPDYWLQLGIAATALDDLDRAKLCFENAYAREKTRYKPNLTRIDNYFSRFEMREAISENDPNLAFKKFIAANERMEKQIFLDTNRHYPFKTGRYFSDVAAKHFSAWDGKQQARFKQAVLGIKEKAEKWKKENKDSNPDVEILIRETTNLLRQI